MSGLDLAIVTLVALFALLAWFRGIVRGLIGLVAWITGLVAGIALAPPLAAWFPPVVEYPLLPQAIAFVVIFVLALVAGALVAWPLRAVVLAAGLGFVDRGLGLAFGVVKALLVVLALVLAAGLTPLPERDWWQNSLLAPRFAEAALALRPWLPKAWAQRLRYPGRVLPAPAKG
jgi:membrane protein required for colicin V production